jgi:hypothetical protein
MSDNRKVTRYVLAYGTIERDVHGPFVEYEEYAKLEALAKKLKAERDKLLTEAQGETIEESEEFKAENLELRGKLQALARWRTDS